LWTKLHNKNNFGLDFNHGSPIFVPDFFSKTAYHYSMGEKEYDAPMHSAEHILNQTMVRMFGCGRAFSTHVERKKSKCDYRFTRMLSQEELAEIEQRVNNVIAQNLHVTESFIPRVEAIQQFNISRVPESAGETLRIVRIGEYDSCPCIGPHVENTSQIGRFKIISADYNEGVLRIRFKRESALDIRYQNQ
jgi:alanyl-tRNA synthetase